MKRNQVIVFYGFPASGKYTIAKKLQEIAGGTLLDNHYFHGMFSGLVEYSQENKIEYFNKIAFLREAFLDVLRKFYIHKKKHRYIFTACIFPDTIIDFARDINADFIPIYLSAPDSVLLSRCNTKYRKSREKIVDREYYSSILTGLHEKIKVCSHENNVCIDTGELSEKQTLDQVLSYIKQFD